MTWTRIVGWSLLAVLLGSGCSSREDQLLFDNLKNRNQQLTQLQQTRKIIIPASEGHETVTLLIRYLPQRSRIEKRETFLVAVHPDTFVASRLNGQSPLRVTECSPRMLNPKEQRGIPSWFTLRCVNFPMQERNDLRLNLLMPWGDQRELLFSKGPRYLITKPKF